MLTQNLRGMEGEGKGKGKGKGKGRGMEGEGKRRKNCDLKENVNSEFSRENWVSYKNLAVKTGYPIRISTLMHPDTCPMGFCGGCCYGEL